LVYHQIIKFQRFNCNVSVVETNVYAYRWYLSRAHQGKDRRVRIFWNKDFKSTVQYWKDRNYQFDALITGGIIIPNSAKHLKDILNEEAPIIMLTRAHIYSTMLHSIEEELFRGKRMVLEDGFKPEKKFIPEVLTVRVWFPDFSPINVFSAASGQDKSPCIKK
uniref:Glucuronosyltransferase n=1 Tax=Gongylonema pulchrum TaxID=637853 RepID=A0A183D512_9BILA